jgi:predicted glycosyltransferase involved in capsule biosynthesis
MAKGSRLFGSNLMNDHFSEFSTLQFLLLENEMDIDNNIKNYINPTEHSGYLTLPL